MKTTFHENTMINTRRTMAAIISLLSLIGVFGAPERSFGDDLPEGARLIADGLTFPEGPIVAPDGTLFFTDVRDNKVYRWRDSEPEVFLDGTDGMNGLAMDRDGAIYSCAAGANALIKIAPDGKRTTVVSQVGGKALNRVNDLVFDYHGNIFFTNPNPGQSGGSADQTPSSVVRVRPDGSATIVATDLTFPNGIGVSADGKFLYVNESLAGSVVYKYPLSPEGDLGPREVLIQFGSGIPDGMAVAESGALYVALNYDAKVVVLSPDGRRVKEYVFPKGSGVTNVCFGGPEMKTLYVTLGNAGAVYALPVDEPGAKPFSHR